MARPPGRRNSDYPERRAALADAASRALVDAEGQPTSLAQVARAVGVSVPTLKHYFDDHDGVIEAALEAARARGQRHLDALRDPGDLALEPSLRAVAADFHFGWVHGVGEIFASGFTHALGNERRGPAAVNHLLEPSLQGLEARLAVHQARGELRPSTDLRAASLCFLAPLMLALLHQRELSGSRCRPLSVEVFAETHLQAWLRGWGAPPA